MGIVRDNKRSGGALTRSAFTILRYNNVRRRRKQGVSLAELSGVHPCVYVVATREQYNRDHRSYRSIVSFIIFLRNFFILLSSRLLVLKLEVFEFKMGLKLNFNACAVIAVLAFAAIVQPGSALHCYMCSTTSEGSSCADPFNVTEHARNMRSPNCNTISALNAYSHEKYVCKKIIQRVNGQREVKRMCAIPNHDEVDITNGPCGVNTATESHVVVESCYICNTDYCNGASSISGMQLLQASAMALVTCALSPSLRAFF